MEYRSQGVDGLRRGHFLPGLVELVLIPVAVNLASTVLYDPVRRLVRRLSPSERRVGSWNWPS